MPPPYQRNKLKVQRVLLQPGRRKGQPPIPADLYRRPPQLQPKLVPADTLKRHLNPLKLNHPDKQHRLVNAAKLTKKGQRQDDHLYLVHKRARKPVQRQNVPLLLNKPRQLVRARNHPKGVEFLPRDKKQRLPQPVKRVPKVVRLPKQQKWRACHLERVPLQVQHSDADV